MKTIQEMIEILEQVSYKKGWKIVFHKSEERPYIQVEFDGEDCETGDIELQKGRKWYLSPFMTNSELVYTAFKAIQAAEDHEMREFFKYKNVKVINPHFSVDDIVDMVNAKQLTEDARPSWESGRKDFINYMSNKK